MPAGAPSFDLAQSALEANQEAGIGLPAGKPDHVVGDGGQPVHARAALAGTLTRHVGGDARRLHQATGVLAQHNDDADTGRRPDGPEGE